MQNLKSLENLHQQPVMGVNDDFVTTMPRGMHGGHFPKANIYSYEEQMNTLLRDIDEPHRKTLSRELLTPSKMD